MIHGHAEIIALLSKQLPVVTMLAGPASIGKWAVAEYFRDQLQVLPQDVLRVHKLTPDTASAVVRFCESAPVGPEKFVIIRTDWAKPAAVNALLKTLEEPGRVKFFLIASEAVAPALRSRAVVYRLGLLSTDQVASVLQERARIPEQSAQKLAQLNVGRIHPTLKQADLAPDRNRLMTVVKGMRDRDVEQVESMAGEWTDDTTELLSEWCYEALTGRLRYFSSDDVSLSQIGKEIPLGILQGLADGPRPRWVIRAVVEPLLRGA